MQPNLINECKKRINKLQSNEKFTVKDLFGDDWGKYFKNHGRNEFGKQFKEEYENGTFPDINWLRKKSDNHHEYMKIN